VARRFVDLVERQLDLFASDEAELLAEVEEALRAYDAAGRDEAEERYGEFVDLADAGRDVLIELREAYAESLDSETAEEYREAFDQRVRKRFPRLAPELE
jgi:hypothetical protein